ncbi:adenylate kinase family protein [Mesomycoplasma molare]|uniref:Adenylate kinase n=1 Tax=Mesomycoplasma molare TaxID=171288 RepID=A0ABY5TUH2_9BACT|nr:nucleoside monophosphate kinase [Mesomycoplasma molare]UWD34309.1 nucleoside monophosphate kinase [Mesomycoplasma molare]
MIKNIIFLGAPGVGKGTIASLLSQKTDLIHLSTGEIFRAAIRNKTKLGLELKNIVESGNYVPDEITNAIVEEKIKELNSKNINFILDGYPRTINQANFLDNLESANISKVILLTAPNEIIIQRLSKRRYCPTCSATYHLDFKPSKKINLCENDDTLLLQRKDDEEESIVRRLEVYNSETKVLVDFYKEKKILIEIEATQSPEEIVNYLLKQK